MLIRKELNLPGVATRVLRSPAGIFFPETDVFADPKNNICAALEREDGLVLVPGANIITNAGDTYYGQKGAGEAVTNAFGVMVLGTGTTATAKTDDFSAVTEIAASEKAFASGYPTTSDADADNGGTTGADVVTYLTSYTKGDFTGTAIAEGCITNATPGVSEPLLTRWLFASSFDKTSNDTLKVFVNHEMNGV